MIEYLWGSSPNPPQVDNGLENDSDIEEGEEA